MDTELLFGTAIGDLPRAVTSRCEAAIQTYRRARKEESREKVVGKLSDGILDLGSGIADWSLRTGGDCTCGECFSVNDATIEVALGEMFSALGQMAGPEQVTRVQTELMQVRSSNLLKLARMSLFGPANTYWGNDYATGLRGAMRRGGCMVTTNPVLIGIAWDTQSVIWIPMRDKIRKQHKKYTPTELAYAITIQVVLENARMLRPIFEATCGEFGHVSLQLSPKNAFDADVMIREALWVWEELKAELGEHPNCVFKVPGTQAGIAVAIALTARGIGVNVTVNFALPQQIAFASAIERGRAPVSYRTQMDGRLDDPVGDELCEAGVLDWEEVKTWATTAIRQREYRLLSACTEHGGMGCKKSRPLPASGRGPWNITRSVHSESEVPLVLTVFPPRQEEFDLEAREIDPDGMWTALPRGYLKKLQKSRLFRMAYEPDGMTVHDFDTYLPVQRTLDEFNGKYDLFLGKVAS